VVPTFAASADFAIDKPAGTPCPNLRTDFRCGIHTRLRERGFAGCAVFDCFGAGQQVAQVTFGGRDWRSEPATAPQMFATFEVMRQLHELYYVTEALDRTPTPQLRRVGAAIEGHTAASPQELLALDLAPLRAEVGELLTRVSEQIRGPKRRNRRGADLVGARLRGADLRGANLRGAYLIGADLGAADLRGADLLGADLRGADIRGTDLTGALFLIQAQLDSATGDRTTRLPRALVHPPHWPVRPA
jgi:hypothetical protein